MHNDIIDTYWSDDKTKTAEIVVNKAFHPDMYKLVMKDLNLQTETFKYFRELSSAQDQAEDFVLGS